MKVGQITGDMWMTIYWFVIERKWIVADIISVIKCDKV